MEYGENNPLTKIKNDIPPEHIELTEGNQEVVHFLAEVARIINIRGIELYGGRLGPEREEGLTEQAIGSAFQSWGEEEIHPDPFDKASVIFRGITGGHPFPDGNKRTGFLLSAYVLEKLGYEIPFEAQAEDIELLCMQISRGDIREIPPITSRLKTIYNITDQNPSEEIH